MRRHGRHGEAPGIDDSGAPRPPPLVNHVLGRQLLITLSVSAAALMFGWIPGYSVLLGGLVSWVSNAYLARKTLGGTDRGSGFRLLAAFYRAELVRITMAAVLLAAVYSTNEEINAIALIVGFVVVHIGAAFTALNATANGRGVPEPTAR